MIKKNTKAIFLDGDYKGEYDWKGGIPLSIGEIMSVSTKGNILKYKLIKKDVVYHSKDDEQLCNITYTFELKQI